MSELVGYPSYDDDEDMAEEENMDLDDSLSALERLNKYKDSHLLLQRFLFIFPSRYNHSFHTILRSLFYSMESWTFF